MKVIPVMFQKRFIMRVPDEGYSVSNVFLL